MVALGAGFVPLHRNLTTLLNCVLVSNLPLGQSPMQELTAIDPQRRRYLVLRINFHIQVFAAGDKNVKQRRGEKQ